MRGVCFVHVLFHHVAKRPNGRLAQVLGTPVKFPSDSRAIALPWHRSSSSQKALWCRGALRVGGVRWAVEVFLGLSLKLLFCNPFLTSPKPDLLQLSLPQPGHQHLLHCALRLGSFGTSWITCTSLIPWATSCSPKTAPFVSLLFSKPEICLQDLKIRFLFLSVFPAGHFEALHCDSHSVLVFRWTDNTSGSFVFENRVQPKTCFAVVGILF